MARPDAASHPAAVAAAFPLATAAGIEMLRSGGNAVDAAVAAAWALCVCEPSASGLGGQTIALIRFADGSFKVIDGHSRAPAAASLELISRDEQRRGYRASTVPTTPAVLQHLLLKYGTLGRHQIMAPAIRIAETGYAITALQRRQAGWVADALEPSAAALYLPEGVPPAGWVLRQPALAKTLRRIAEVDAEDFYRGRLARAIARDMAANGGLITERDLAGCEAPLECAPVSACYRGYRVVTVPAPGGGPQLLRSLRLLERLLPSGSDVSEEEWRAAIALTVAEAFRERERTAAHPQTWSWADVDPACNEDTLRSIAAGLRDARITDRDRPAAEEPGDTTHLSACDRSGNVVALTQSIQSLFGAKAAHRDLGFLYNNYLRTCPRRPHPHGLAANCRPRSNAAPTLVLSDANETAAPLLLLGAAGSRRITSSILQVISGVIDRHLDVDAAVAAPRVHGLTNGKVWVEAPAATQRLLEQLATLSCRPIVKPRRNYAMGAVQALHFLADGGVRGAADPRRDGTAETLPAAGQARCEP
jgi:gamma-glutamyltranspeptidase / glutathione hydrolase